MKLPIKLEGGSNKILANEGGVVAECPGGFPFASALVLAANAYPYLVEMLKGFAAGEGNAAEAEKFLRYLGEIPLGAPLKGGA